jgi:branched-chain amino acid transport system ATP-binding protein
MRPRLLLLDEPAAGLPHTEVQQLIETVRRLRDDDDITVVIVEHNMGLIAALTDRVVVLDHGRKLMEGTAAQAQSDPRVIEAYIGKDAADGAA